MQNYRLILFLLDIPWWLYTAVINLIREQGTDSQIKKCPTIAIKIKYIHTK